MQGHSENGGYEFSLENYQTTPGSYINENLTLSQDAARINLGEPWRMPSSEEFLELHNNCRSEWTELKGIPGILFTSNVNGNTLFFPAAGRYDGLVLDRKNTGGFYWSTRYISETLARSFEFNEDRILPQDNVGRRRGFTIRAVVGTGINDRSVSLNETKVLSSEDSFHDSK